MLLRESRTILCLALFACAAITLNFCAFAAEDKPAEGQKAEEKKPEAKTATPPPMPNFTPPPAPKLPFTDVPEIVARVEGEEILGKDFTAAMETTARMQAMQASRNPNRDPNTPLPPFTEAEARELLDNMIAKNILLILAEKAGISISDEDIDSELLKMGKGRMTLEQIKSLVEKQGGTMEAVRSRAKMGLLLDLYMDKIAADIKATDEEIQAEYNKLKDAGRLERPQTADVAHVLVKVDKSADEATQAEAKKRIDEAHARVVAGEDFGKVAEEVSEDPGSAGNGGAYPGVRKGQMVPEFENACFTQPVGEIGKPFKTQYGWHFVKVDKRTEPETIPLEEVAEKIGEMLDRPKKGERLQETIAEARKTLKVEIFLPKASDAEEKPKEEEVTLPLNPS